MGPPTEHEGNQSISSSLSLSSPDGGIPVLPGVCVHAEGMSCIILNSPLATMRAECCAPAGTVWHIPPRISSKDANGCWLLVAGAKTDSTKLRCVAIWSYQCFRTAGCIV
ncbi:hypothetical protein O6H91_14G066300 [Diphasiastrum complanatum]|uniref:Uncharacterized protein n=1 Tax=Diphasiastrum complanatum TaxID=34168 RepID=A0ACC2BQB5_DIPCM|nr:hypothetical protein O6H91_14G066300 [Diphasiastrum complanatum]